MVVETFSSSVLSFISKRAAPPPGGLLNGHDPTIYNPSEPIRLWIVELGIIISTASILAVILKKIKQPKVIAEVIGGIILGPTALGRVEGFRNHIFPTDDNARVLLTLTANIGLCLFLFIIGLEIDLKVVTKNVKLSSSVAIAGMVLPFGLGAALSVPLHNQFLSEDVRFSYFMLFTGVAFSITAFPVLCRILTEVKLLDTDVGVVVLSAGVGNDIVGWVLLALSVALTSAGSGLTALYILLVCVGWSLLMLYPIRWALKYLARVTGSIDNGPTMVFMTVTILILFGSAFFTDIIGVHAIFGAFLAGTIVPREGGLTIALTEKLEDMVSIIFLPLYFTLSGLNTNLTLLNDGITWGYIIAICVLAFLGKFIGCTAAAKLTSRMSWRESFAIGSLMSCKGLVELIVLNVGRQAGIFDERVFSMFVVMALILTFVTTPMVELIYPLRYRTRPITDTSGITKTEGDDEETPTPTPHPSEPGTFKSHFTVVLDRFEHIPGMMALSQVLQPSLARPAISEKRAIDPPPPPYIDALRLVELSDRGSAVMRSSNTSELVHTDPLLKTYKTFGELNGLAVHSHLSIVPYDDLAHTVSDHARQHGSDMIILPWLLPATDMHPAEISSPSSISNPFDAWFRGESGSAVPSQFVRGVFAQASGTDVALFVDQHQSNKISSGYGKYHVFLPFFGGPDDRLALDFVAQLCASDRVTATVVRVTKTGEDVGSPLSAEGREHGTVASIAGFPDTIYGAPTTQTRMHSETADNVAWSRYADPSSANPPVHAEILSRMGIQTLASATPIQSIVSTVQDMQQSKKVVIVTGRSRRLAVVDHSKELKAVLGDYRGAGSEVRKTVGDVAASVMGTKSGSAIIIVQAARD